MFQIDFSHSIPKMDLPEMPPQDLILLSLSTAAVLASAVGLWRIRAIGSKPEFSVPPAPAVGPAEPAPVQISPTANCHVEEVGSPKERFTVCYSAGDCHVDEEVDEDEEAEERGGERNHLAVTGLREWGLQMGVRIESELGVIKRRGDLGWYRYQDMTAINGSVVRLWGR